MSTEQGSYNNVIMEWCGNDGVSKSLIWKVFGVVVLRIERRNGELRGIPSRQITASDERGCVTSSTCPGRGSRVKELRILKQQMNRAPPLSLRSGLSDLAHEGSRNAHPNSAALGPVAKQDKVGASCHMGRACSQETDTGREVHPSRSSKCPVTPISSAESTSKWDETTTLVKEPSGPPVCFIKGPGKVLSVCSPLAVCRGEGRCSLGLPFIK